MLYLRCVIGSARGPAISKEWTNKEGAQKNRYTEEISE